jgi:PAS domain S-box-containing protein
MQIKVDQFLNAAKNDIFYLRDSFVFRQFITYLADNNQDKFSEWKQVVQEQFRDFAKNREIYYQFRILDRFANEIMRIEYDGSQATIVPEAQLTNRQDVFYLYYAENSTNQELLYTPVELSNDKPPKSIVPAISYFIPVYANSNGRGLQAILIANVYAQELFDILNEESLVSNRKTILADNNGHYLFNSQKSEWNKLLALRKEGNVDNDFPSEVRDQILSGNVGLIDGNWDEIIAYAPIFFTGTVENFMVLFQSISRDVIRQPIKSFIKLVLIFGSFSFAIALLFGFIAADQFTRPIKALRKGSEMLAKGNLDYRITINTNDEIEQLANDFNRMADDLKKHERQLKDYAENLESKVKERTKELSKTLSYLQNLIDSSIDAIITLDKNLVITFYSRGAEEILGYRSEEVLGGKICSFCDDCIVEECPIAEAAEQRTKKQHYQIDFKNKRGEQVPLSMSLSPIKNEHGEAIGILTISKDMTEQKRMEQQIQQAEKLAGIGQLAAGMAHQLNTPLASIILSTQMLKDMAKEEEILDDLCQIERQADHCKMLIQDLLTFSRQSDKNKTKIRLEETINIAIRIMQKEFSNRDIHIMTDFCNGGSQIYGNNNQIEQLFFNLLKNAGDAMPKGGEIRISTMKVSNALVRVRISDTGVGIAKENLSKIFDPFFTTKDVGQGTGLGLSVCYRIVEEHNGSIEVESELQKGASFTVIFPLSIMSKVHEKIQDTYS